MVAAKILSTRSTITMVERRSLQAALEALAGSKRATNARGWRRWLIDESARRRKAGAVK